MPTHEYCTEDDCPCFLAGEKAAWGQMGDYLEDAEERIMQIRRDFVERYENRTEGRQGAEVTSDEGRHRQRARLAEAIFEAVLGDEREGRESEVSE